MRVDLKNLSLKLQFCIIVSLILFVLQRLSQFIINRQFGIQQSFNMAKKYKSTKLLKQTIAATQKPASVFGKFANRLADARKKKIQKMTDTQKRLLESKKNNKMIKVTKKAKKFALLDEDNPDAQGATSLSLTHRGIKIRDLKEFDDVNLGESDMQNDEQFDQIQDKMNFAGFQASGNLLEERKQTDDKKQKTQSQIYKEIIEKSKAYKMFRQQVYEENLNIANELDEGFDNLMSQLKFRNRDQQLLQRLQNRDLQYDKLLNELKDDERIVSNKIVEKNEKYTEKIRKKKNDQLNKLMKDSDGEDDDIRGWVDEAGEEEQSEPQERSDDEEDQDELDASQNDEEEQGSYDELDDVELSSEQENQDGEQNQDQDQFEASSESDGENNEQEVEDDEEDGQQQDLQSDDEDEDQLQEQDDDEESEESEESEKIRPLPGKRSQPTQQTLPPKQILTQNRNQAQKKRKLHFIE